MFRTGYGSFIRKSRIISGLTFDLCCGANYSVTPIRSSPVRLYKNAVTLIAVQHSADSAEDRPFAFTGAAGGWGMLDDPVGKTRKGQALQVNSTIAA